MQGPPRARGLLLAALLTAGPGGLVQGNVGTTSASSPAGAPASDRVLFVGNSLTEWHHLPLVVEALSAAAGRPLSVEWVTYGGVSLEDHWSRKTQDRIARSTWPPSRSTPA